MVFKAVETSFHDLPAMDPESSMRKMVSKVERKAYGLSPAGTAGSSAGATAGAVEVVGEVGV